jgi:raffinose/stachyose/melibiose transport system permease protein
VNWVGFDNYDEFLFQGLASRDNIAATVRTLVFCVAVTFIQFTLGLILALLLNQNLRGRTFFRTLFFIPVILGVVIQGLMWRLFLLPRGGPMANLFGLFGIQSEFLGGQPNEAFMWVIVVQIWANVGITMVIFLAGMQTISEDLYEAARIDGASNWQIFWNVTWPQLTPAINTNFLLNIVGSLQAWQLFFVLVGWKPGTQVLGYLIFAQGFGQTDVPAFRQGFAAAASIVLFFIVLIIGFAANKVVSWREERYM